MGIIALDLTGRGATGSGAPPAAQTISLKFSAAVPLHT